MFIAYLSFVIFLLNSVFLSLFPQSNVLHVFCLLFFLSALLKWYWFYWLPKSCFFLRALPHKSHENIFVLSSNFCYNIALRRLYGHLRFSFSYTFDVCVTVSFDLLSLTVGWYKQMESDENHKNIRKSLERFILSSQMQYSVWETRGTIHMTRKCVNTILYSQGHSPSAVGQLFTEAMLWTSKVFERKFIFVTWVIVDTMTTNDT